MSERVIPEDLKELYALARPYAERYPSSIHVREYTRTAMLIERIADLQAKLEEERAELEEIKRAKLQFALEAQAAFTAKCAELQLLRTDDRLLKALRGARRDLLESRLSALQQSHDRLINTLKLIEHKVDQHIQGQYHHNNAALGTALATARAAIAEATPDPYDALKTRCENCETLLLDEQVIMTRDEVPLCAECAKALATPAEATPEGDR